MEPLIKVLICKVCWNWWQTSQFSLGHLFKVLNAEKKNAFGAISLLIYTAETEPAAFFLASKASSILVKLLWQITMNYCILRTHATGL